MAKLQELKNKVAQLSLVREEFENMDRRLRARRLSLPSKEYFSAFLKQLQDHARESGNEVRAISFELGTPQGGQPAKPTEASKKLAYEQIKVPLEIQGDYLSIYNFLERLMRFKQIIAVEDIDLKAVILKTEGGPGERQAAVKLSLVYLIFKEGEKGGK